MTETLGLNFHFKILALVVGLLVVFSIQNHKDYFCISSQNVKKLYIQFKDDVHVVHSCGSKIESNYTLRSEVLVKRFTELENKTYQMLKVLYPLKISYEVLILTRNLELNVSSNKIIKNSSNKDLLILDEQDLSLKKQDQVIAQKKLITFWLDHKLSVDSKNLKAQNPFEYNKYIDFVLYLFTGTKTDKIYDSAIVKNFESLNFFKKNQWIKFFFSKDPFNLFYNSNKTTANLIATNEAIDKAINKTKQKSPIETPKKIKFAFQANISLDELQDQSNPLNFLSDLKRQQHLSDIIFIFKEKVYELKNFEFLEMTTKSLDIHQTLYFECEPLKVKLESKTATKKINDFVNKKFISDKLVRISHCNFNHKFAFNVLFKQGLKDFLSVEKDIEFIQFHLPSLKMMTRFFKNGNLIGTSNINKNSFDFENFLLNLQPYQLSHNQIDSLGWKGLIWNSKYNFHQPISPIDVIPYFRARIQIL